MTTFTDALLVRLAQPDGLLGLLLPDTDPGRQRIRALFAEMYRLPFAAVREVLEVRVLTSACQQPVFGVRRADGSWLQAMPATSRGDFQVSGRDRQPRWVDVSAEVAVTVALSIDAGGVESFRLADIGEFATLAEFREKFEYFDLNAFMARHKLSTVEDLRAAFQYLLGEVRLKPAPEPDAPAEERRFSLNVAVLIRDAIDLAGALRDVRLLTSADTGYRREHGEAEAHAPVAPMLVLPSDAVPATGLTPDQITGFFASQQILAVLETP